MSSLGSAEVIVSASDVSDAFYCTYRLKHRCDGVAPSSKFKKKALSGIKKHDYQNRIGVDRRCFVSSYVFGPDDLRTSQLRLFRDQFLMTFCLGRFVVSVYYLVSPHFVRFCVRFPLMGAVVKGGLGWFIRLL